MRNVLSKYLLWLLALEGVGCIAGQYLAPVSSGKLIAVTALAVLVLAGLAGWLQYSPGSRENLAKNLDRLCVRPLRFYLASGFCVFLFCAGWAYLFVPVERKADLLNFYLLSRPAAVWLTACAAELGLALLFWRGVRWPFSADYRKLFTISGLIALIFALLWIVIAITRVGLDPVGIYWASPGTPLLLLQVLLAALLGGVTLAFELRRGEAAGRPGWRLDGTAGLLLWGLAFALWASTPATRPTSFLPTPVAPNYAPYPFSDAGVYDVNAQDFMIGKNLSLDLQLKPAYSLFLVFLHGLAGQDYGRLVNLQLVFLAFIPVLLYVLGFMLSGRPVGLMAALLFILREKNSIELSSVIQVSDSKMLLSDLPAAGLLILIMILVVGWLQKPGARRLWPLAAGGVLGLFLLLRTQIVVAIPFILVGAALALYQKRRALFIQGTLLMLTGILASTLPWAGYSYFSGSQINSPGYLSQLATQFRIDPTDPSGQPRQLPGETAAQFGARVEQQFIQFVRENPALVAESIGAYFARNLIQSVLYLPLSAQLETQVVTYVHGLPFWDSWAGALPEGSGAMLVVNLLLLAFGIGAAFKRFRAIGLLPVWVFAGYIVGLALPMVSGWRFLLPADWIVGFYLAIAWIELLGLCRFLFPAGQVEGPVASESPTDAAGVVAPLSRPRFAALTLFFLLLNLSLPVGKALTPVKYPLQTQDQLLAVYAAKAQAPAASALPATAVMAGFLQQPNAIALYGRALYPRFYEGGEGLHSTGWASFTTRDYSRMGFVLAGPQDEDIVLPLETAPAVFPQAADVWVFGCVRQPDRLFQRYVQAWVVIVRAADQDVFVHSSLPVPDCAAAQ